MAGASLTRVLALGISIAAHGGILAWLVLAPAPSPLPEQQIVDVDFVTISTPETQPAPPTPDPVQEVALLPEPKVPVQKEGILPKQKTKPAPPPAAETLPTTGTPAEDAQKNVAAANTANTSAQPLHNPAPVYPALARRKGREGTVMLLVNVSPQGKADEVHIATSSGFEQLDNAAQETVQKWQFIPAQQNGQPIATTLRLPIVFRLD